MTQRSLLPYASLFLCSLVALVPWPPPSPSRRRATANGSATG